jgi:hypothetical protein
MATTLRHRVTPGAAAREYAGLDDSPGGPIVGTARTLENTYDEAEFGPGGTQPGHARSKHRSRIDQAADMAIEEPAAPEPTEHSHSDMLKSVLEQLKALAAGQAALTEGQAALTASVNEVKGSVASVHGAVDEIKQQVQGLAARMGSAEEGMRAQAQSIAALRTDVASEKAARKRTDKTVAENKAAVEGEFVAMDEQLKKIVDGASKTDAEVERMNQLVAELSTTLAELRSAPQTFAAAVGGAGGQAPARGGRQQDGDGLVRDRLQEEGRTYGRIVKLVGIVSKERAGPGGQEALARVRLCTEAGKALSALLGGMPITVERAAWLNVRGGGPPKLLVVMPTLDMAQALRALRGTPGGTASKLAPGQSITNEYGPVEQAVRRVLLQEKASVPDSWVGRSALMSREAGRLKVHPLSHTAIAAGQVAMHTAAEQPQRAQRAEPMAL